MNKYENRPAARALASRGYLGYLWLGIKGTTVYAIYDKIVFAARKYALLSRIIKISASVVSFVNTSATLIVVFGVLAVLTPALMAVGAIFLASRAVSYRRLDKYFGSVNTPVYAFAFCETSRVASFTAAEISERGKVVFITSSLSKIGYSGAALRRDGTLLVHVGYYFRMKKILEKNEVKIYFIM